MLGFSFTGGTVPAGCGTLTVLAGDVTGILDDSDLVFSSPAGESVDMSVYDYDDECDDLDDDGICDYDDECVGEYDECSVCNGDGIADGACDCDGNVEDECGK